MTAKLRKDAVNAIANYMHHELFEVVPVNVLPWIKEQAEQIVSMCDNAIENTKIEGKKKGLIL